MVRRPTEPGREHYPTCYRRKKVNVRKSPFDSVCDLAADPSLIGRALRRLPEWLLREADRWCRREPDIADRDVDVAIERIAPYRRHVGNDRNPRQSSLSIASAK